MSFILVATIAPSIRHIRFTPVTREIPTQPWRYLTGPTPHPPLDSRNASSFFAPLPPPLTHTHPPGSLPALTPLASPTRLPQPDVGLPLSPGRPPGDHESISISTGRT